MWRFIMRTFRALVVDRVDEEHKVGIGMKEAQELPSGGLLIRVEYSSMNYKDALALSKSGGIVRAFPHIPGIDLAGVVEESEDERYQKGDRILVTGYELGVSHFGGYAEYARIPADWAVPLPLGLSAREAMAIGTAGFTAALSVEALQANGVVPGDGPVLVTGATGGVGSMALSILSQLGYETVASTGKPELEPLLRQLGATRVISRSDLLPERIRPLDKQLWAGAVDCVGGPSLPYILSSTRYGGTVAVSGLTGGAEWSATVYPFILRGVRLIGIDSVYTPMEHRVKLWEKLAGEMKPAGLKELTREIALEQVPDLAQELLQGQSWGRVVVKV
jgi:acrylyl-CoA reductase (NADPH)